MAKKKRNPKKMEIKSPSEVQKAEASGRISAFNKELQALAEKYQVRLDISQRIVVVDNKPQKASK